MIRRTAMVILYRPHQQTNTCSKSETKTLEITEDNSNKGIFKKQTAGVFYKKKEFFNILQHSDSDKGAFLFCEFCAIFKNTFFAEHLRVTASDIRM